MEIRNQNSHRRERDALEHIKRFYYVIEESKITQTVIAGRGEERKEDG